MNKKLAKNTAYLTMAAVGQKLIAFIYFLLVAKVMQPSLTGEYFLATSFVIIFSVIADFGITPVIIREIAKNKDRTKEILKESLGLKIPLIIIAIAAAIITSQILDYSPQLSNLILLATIVLGIDAIHLLFYGVLRGHEKLQFESWGVIAAQTITFAVGGLSLWLNPDLKMLVVALILGSVTNFLFATYHIIRLFGWQVLIPAFNKTRAKWMLATAFPFALAAAFVKIYSYVDSIFLSKMLGEYYVGIYAVAYKFTYAFQFLPSAFTAALYPNLSALARENSPEMGSIMKKAFIYMALVSAPIVCGIIGIAPELVLLTTEQFSSAAVVLQVLVLVLIPIFLDFPIGALLNATGRQATKATIYGITMLINVVFNLLLIPEYFVMGAAYAALISFTCLFLMGTYYVPKIIPGFSWWKIIKDITPIYLSAGVMLLCVVWLKPLIGWQLVIPIGAVVYGALILLSGVIAVKDLKQLRKI